MTLFSMVGIYLRRVATQEKLDAPRLGRGEGCGGLPLPHTFLFHVTVFDMLKHFAQVRVTSVCPARAFRATLVPCEHSQQQPNPSMSGSQDIC